MRRKVIQRILCLFVAAVLACGSLPAAAADDAGAAATLVLQAGYSCVVKNGAEVCLTAGAPYYAANGAQMVPLRFTAESLGLSVSWNAAARQAVVTGSGGTLVFTPGSWTCTLGGKSVSLPSPAAVKDGALCVPAGALARLGGVYFHAFGYYDGAFLVLSNRPVTAGDSAGAPNAAFSADSPDPALAALRDAALKLLGPNQGMLARNAVVLRLGSRHVSALGAAKDLCGENGKVAPFRSADGYLMAPIRLLAESFGGTCALDADGATRVVLGGRTAVFPAENGYFTLDGVKMESKNYGGCRRDGESYCSAAAFAAAFGLYAFYDSGTQGLLLSRYNVSARADLLRGIWKSAAALKLQRDESAKGYLALTFDDGPSGAITERLLDGLKARGAHATFFLCNYRIKVYPGPMSRYLAEGHEIGNHSATHATLTRCSAPTLASELDLTSASIKAYTGSYPILMRPPGGAYNKTVLSAAGARGMSCVLWSLDTQDWKYRNKQHDLNAILSNVKDGDIILMHDMYNSSVDAALSAIDTLQAEGYRFVTVSELAAIKGKTVKPGAVYSQIR